MQRWTVKMLEETGTKISISTVKQVLYRHNLKGRSAWKKPLLQNRHKKARLGWQHHALLQGNFAAGGTGALHKIDGIMRQENDVAILKQHLKTSVSKLKLGHKWVFQMDNTKY